MSNNLPWMPKILRNKFQIPGNPINNSQNNPIIPYETRLGKKCPCCKKWLNNKISSCPRCCQRFIITPNI